MQCSESKLSEVATSKLRLQLSQYEAEVANLQESNLRLLSHSKEYQNVITLLENERDGVSEQLLESESKCYTLLTDFTFLKEEMENIKLITSAHQSDSHMHSSHVQKLKAEIMQLQEENLRRSVDEMNNDKLSASFLTENPPLIAAPGILSVLETGGGEYRIGKGGFEEFVLLKKENKTLKLQVFATSIWDIGFILFYGFIIYSITYNVRNHPLFDFLYRFTYFIYFRLPICSRREVERETPFEITVNIVQF